MKALTKRLQIAINEGAWGYSPQDSDLYLDTRDELVDKLFANIVDLLKSEDSNTVWSGVGLAIEFSTLLKDIIYYSDVKTLDTVLLPAINKLNGDTEWQNTWDNPEEMLNSIKNAQKSWSAIKTQHPQ
jgi:hypothetical protein